MTKYDLAANLTLAGLDTYTGKLPAAQQRTLFGAVLFGKKTIEITCDGQGEIIVFHATWEGRHTSYSREFLSFDEVCRKAAHA